MTDTSDAGKRPDEEPTDAVDPAEADEPKVNPVFGIGLAGAAGGGLVEPVAPSEGSDADRP